MSTLWAAAVGQYSVSDERAALILAVAVLITLGIYLLFDDLTHKEVDDDRRR